MNPDFPEDGIVVGGDVDEVTVSLRVAAPDLDPSAITGLLGTKPTFAARKGDRRPSGNGEVVQRTGIWSLHLQESPEWHLGDAIDALLAKLPADLNIWRKVASVGDIDLFCGLHLRAWNRGLELTPAQLGRLAERGIALSIDIYCNDADEEADA